MLKKLKLSKAVEKLNEIVNEHKDEWEKREQNFSFALRSYRAGFVSQVNASF